MTSATTARVHPATWSIVFSVMMIAAGVLAIGLPQVAGVAVTEVVAWLLIFSGVLHVAFAWRPSHAVAVIWEILLGLVYGAIGFYLMGHPVAGLASLTLAVAFYLVVEGVLEFVLSVRLRGAPGAGWLLFDGVITLVLAVMIGSTWPSSAAWVVGTLVGLSMFFSGITRLMLSMTARRIVV